MTGTEFDVWLSVADRPVSLVASCFRPTLAVTVRSSVNEPVPAVDEMLPAASVDTTLSCIKPSVRPVAGMVVPLIGVAVAVLTDQLPLLSVVAVNCTAMPFLSVTVTVTVLPASAVPTRTGFATLVRLSLVEVPLSFAVSCLRLIVGAVDGGVRSSTNELVPTDDLLPAVSVATTVRATAPSARPVPMLPVVATAVCVLIDQLPLESVVVSYVILLPA